MTNTSTSVSDPDHTESASAIRAEGVWKIFGPGAKQYGAAINAGEKVDPGSIRGTAAVVDANFEIAKGETFVVMGLSGSGKSTLLRTLNGLNPATAGQVYINDQPVNGTGAEELRRIRRDELSMVFQHFALLPHKNVLDNVSYGLEIRGVERRVRTEQAMNWIERVGLTANERRFPDQLSGGMRQRVGLARALAAETDILLMDEAFSALDPVIRADLQQQLLDLQAELGKTIVFITHDLNEAMRLGDRIAIMRKGQIVQLGTTSDILNRPANDYVSRFTADVDRSRVLTAGMVADRTPPVFAPHDDATKMIAELENAGHTGGVVLDGQKVVGSVTMLNLQGASGRAVDLVGPQAPVSRYTPIGDLFGAAAAQPEPLVIVGRDGGYVGLLARDRMLDSMSHGGDAQ